MQFISWANGSKTYVVCAVGIALGIAQAFNIHIPDYVNWVLVFLGGTALRHGIQTQSAQATEDVIAVAKTVLDQVTLKPTK